MEEAGDAMEEATVFVVYKGFEDAAFLCAFVFRRFHRDDIVVGNGGGDEAAVSLGEQDLVSRGAEMEAAGAFEAHGDDEGVVLDEVAMEGGGDLADAYREVGGVHNEGGAVLASGIVGAIVVLDGIVEGLGGQCGMELAGTTVGIGAAVVVYAVGDVATLLDLGQQDATTDGMDAPGGDIEDIAALDFVAGKDFGDGAVGYTTTVLLGGYLLTETGIEGGAGLGMDDIPHLCLAHLVVLAKGHLIVGMYLYAEVGTGIDKLGQEGKLASPDPVALLAQEGCSPLFDDFGEGTALHGTVEDYTGLRGDGTDFPRFTDRLIVGRQPFPGFQLMAAPYDGLQVGMEQEGVHVF